MKSLYVQNIRCLSSDTPVPLAPLTLLIGENSTGKSTFLAAARLAWDIAHGALAPDFYEEPFDLGSFDQIATYRGGRRGRAQWFEVGYETDPQPFRLGRLRRLEKTGASNAPIERRTVTHRARFRRGSGAQPELEKISITAGEDYCTIDFGDQKNGSILTIKSPRGEDKIEIHGPADLGSISRRTPATLEYLYFLFYQQRRNKGTGRNALFRQVEFLDALDRIIRADDFRPYASAPIRTRPQRTYNPVKDTPLPEGGHVPMILARRNFYRAEEWKSLKAALDDFGQKSGLFNSIGVKRLGKQLSDPFQIQLKIFGPAFNLADVGYGVSQILPVIVDLIISGKEQLFLLQQPEVHLHPRAQASLGSFVGALVKSDRKRFMIETHSDYLVDRIRMDVRDKYNLKPEDVSILYFERHQSEVRIFPITIDDAGNLQGVPVGYREFFLSEERRLLGLDSNGNHHRR